MRLAFIMAGGSGERFWPLSRKLHPKQLLRLGDPDRTMLQEAIDRITPAAAKDGVYIATTPHLQTPIQAAHPDLSDNVLAEPAKRNTLGCLCWAAATIIAEHDDADEICMMVVTADHKISNQAAFIADVEAAASIAEQTKGLVTIGIRPTRAETGYGYVECGESVGPDQFRVKTFREKPDRATAETFIADDKFLWNSGMFFWTVQGFMKELATANPDALRATNAIADCLAAQRIHDAIEAFQQLPNLSIDYALMERAEHVFVVRSHFDWDDVGSFDALLRTMPTDDHGNVSIGNVSVKDCRGCIFYNLNPNAVLSAVGLNDMVLVQTSDSVMVTHVSDAQRVKELVALLADTPFV